MYGISDCSMKDTLSMENAAMGDDRKRMEAVPGGQRSLRKRAIAATDHGKKDISVLSLDAALKDRRCTTSCWTGWQSIWRTECR